MKRKDVPGHARKGEEFGNLLQESIPKTFPGPQGVPGNLERVEEAIPLQPGAAQEDQRQKRLPDTAEKKRRKKREGSKAMQAQKAGNLNQACAGANNRARQEAGVGSVAMRPPAMAQGTETVLGRRDHKALGKGDQMSYNGHERGVSSLDESANPFYKEAPLSSPHRGEMDGRHGGSGSARKSRRKTSAASQPGDRNTLKLVTLTAKNRSNPGQFQCDSTRPTHGKNHTSSTLRRIFLFTNFSHFCAFVLANAEMSGIGHSVSVKLGRPKTLQEDKVVQPRSWPISARFHS